MKTVGHEPGSFLSSIVTTLPAAAFGFAAPAAAPGAFNDEVAGTPIIVFHNPGTAGALDGGAMAEGRDVGSMAVSERTLSDRLTYRRVRLARAKHHWQPCQRAATGRCLHQLGAGGWQILPVQSIMDSR